MKSRLVMTAIAMLMAAAPAAAIAQNAPATPAPPAAPAAPAAPSAAAKATTGDWTGKWSGQVIQVGRSKSYLFNLSLSGKGGSTSYPDENCVGTLTRTGSSGDYVFFTETITTGKLDVVTKKGCLSGSITLVRAGPALVMGWVAAYDGKPIIAYGTLSRLP